MVTKSASTGTGLWMCERPPAGATNVAQPSFTSIVPSGETTVSHPSLGPVPSKRSWNGESAPRTRPARRARPSQTQQGRARIGHSRPIR